MSRNIRDLFAFVIALSSCVLAASPIRAEAQPKSGLHIAKTWKLGGEGGWDYATLNETGSLLFLPRTTHTIVVDTATGKKVAGFSKTVRAHGVALVPDVGRGFITDGKKGTVTIFDAKTYAILGEVKAADDADGIIYDSASRRLFVACGDANVVVPIDPAQDPKSAKADPAIDLGGKPEFLAADGHDRLYVNLEDKNLVAVVNTKTMKILSKWPTGAGTEPTGVALDSKGGHLFVGCRNEKLIVMSVKDGAVLAELPIGKGVDAVAFRDGTAFASCGDGTLTVVSELSPLKFKVEEMVKTAAGARTMAVDARTGTVYLPAAEMDPPEKEGGRPKPRPDTFKVIVIETESLKS